MCKTMEKGGDGLCERDGCVLSSVAEVAKEIADCGLGWWCGEGGRLRGWDGVHVPCLDDDETVKVE